MIVAISVWKSRFEAPLPRGKKPSTRVHGRIVNMHQSPNAVSGFLKDLRLTPLRVVRGAIQLGSMESPRKLRPSAVAVERDLQAALLQLPLGEVRAKKPNHQLITNRLIGGVIAGRSDERHLIAMRPDAIHDRRVARVDRKHSINPSESISAHSTNTKKGSPQGSLQRSYIS